ncbi:MAG: hypothetical protein ACK5RV_07205 [Flavobacterium sp.]|uniref:hypothetical protein n=1 Tax=Flavobacterium sp. TaxID=239 RepID=UPI0022C61722|nr:hypothetical protein [Flavobacterium sp.]MCZ8295858.1 hypothetical protein [Flavobacterium sp.]
MAYLWRIAGGRLGHRILGAEQQAFGIHDRKSQPENGALRLRKNTSLLLSFWNTGNLRKVLFTT